MNNNNENLVNQTNSEDFRIEEYTFKFQNFDGPLDLLLSLVKDKKISLFEINLLEIANQYLKIISQIRESEIDLASDYLVMAASLIQLKAKLLLDNPNEEEQQEVEQEKQQLLQQLIEYQQFKNLKDTLKKFEDERQEIFIKKPSNVDEFILDDDNSQLDGHSNPVKLISVLRKMFERIYANKLRQTKIDNFNLTPAEQVVKIKELLATRKTLEFEEIFNQPSLKHFIVTLIALLDLARQQYLKIEQDNQFDKLRIIKGDFHEE
ncbi:segregation/condensation protein A [Mycoplasmopsis glycophila]|uniref:Segregation and condensation protein A n=1 Tax=Mycoplasmopsis glycophila TaxID=171285 RepID=A0A449AUX2_9BACT|nr:segregation/condensation protein A [Mycoplasmopsis glycophila]VEU70286.1 ScpA/B protein [Mycoplasmopsis glycophila]